MFENLYTINADHQHEVLLLTATRMYGGSLKNWYKTPYEALVRANVPVPEELVHYINDSFVYSIQVEGTSVHLITEKLDDKRSERFYVIRGKQYRKDAEFHSTPIAAINYAISYWTKLQSKRHPDAKQVLTILADYKSYYD